MSTKTQKYIFTGKLAGVATPMIHNQLIVEASVSDALCTALSMIDNVAFDFELKLNERKEWAGVPAIRLTHRLPRAVSTLRFATALHQELFWSAGRATRRRRFWNGCLCDQHCDLSSGMLALPALFQSWFQYFSFRTRTKNCKHPVLIYNAPCGFPVFTVRLSPLG